jgi:hypothetical protein
MDKVGKVRFNYQIPEFQEFQDPIASPKDGVLDCFLDTKSIQNVPVDFMPVRLDRDPSDPDLFKSARFGLVFTIDELSKLEGLRPFGIELSCSSTLYILYSIYQLKKHDPGFEMKDPGWRWSADDGSWNFFPKPNHDSIWSSLQTWEKSCESELCKKGGCNGLSPHFDSGKYPGLLSEYQNSLNLFSGNGGNFCEQVKENCKCENCGRLYDPHNPSDVGYHASTRCHGWYPNDDSKY